MMRKVMNMIPMSTIMIELQKVDEAVPPDPSQAGDRRAGDTSLPRLLSPWGNSTAAAGLTLPSTRGASHA
jgi:hypothetical protein